MHKAHSKVLLVLQYQGSKRLGPHIQPKQKATKRVWVGECIGQNLEKGGKQYRGSLKKVG